MSECGMSTEERKGPGVGWTGLGKAGELPATDLKNGAEREARTPQQDRAQAWT